MHTEIFNRQKFINRLENESSQLRPYDLLTQSYNDDQDIRVDIEVAIVEKPESEGSAFRLESETIKNELALSRLYELLNAPGTPKTIFLLIEDVSHATTTVLCEYLKIEPSIIHNHLIGMNGFYEDGTRTRPHRGTGRAGLRRALTNLQINTVQNNQNEWETECYSFDIFRRRDF
ncbi:hypothetical protein H072_8250 [Dactylellina haptotyla CBS 200.50]|uniref:Uncharacterized protein n=1 Tax=Dactylellina haptotyla (strain CBS 200.50) TaxID=1284197 RepID=S8BFG2_DACHA|nr:hypothetical protein H072_8250 [Dactylellina haptotyla CBS 200.50]